MDIDKNQLTAIIQEETISAEKHIAAMFGQQLYKQQEGFSQEEIYKLCGKDDSVVTITLRPNSDSFVKYGSNLTCQVVYTPKERSALNASSTTLNADANITVKVLIDDNGNVANPSYMCEVSTSDIISMLVLPSAKEENKFYSKDKRKPNVLEIPFESFGNGNDIGWTYGALTRFIEDGIALTPEEYSQYLAYKLVLDKDNLSSTELSDIFNVDGQIKNNDVAIFLLEWKKQANLLTQKDEINLLTLNNIRTTERLSKLDELLKGIGGLKRFSEKYPQKAQLIIDKTLSFHEHRYNIDGEHLLYLNLDGFLHIYLRHVEELTIAGLYSERTKFQLEEKDVEITIKHVMKDLNDEYQEFREKYPNRQFRKYKDDAYYYNGDYYELRVDSAGRLIQFFKLSVR